jgi:predicted CopG family antitoxin
MTSAEIKLDLFRTLDKLKKEQLSELSGVISNYLLEHHNEEDWKKLTSNQKKALLDAKLSIRKNGGTSHSDAMKEFRQRSTNA